MTVSICAVVAARNEAAHLRRLLPQMGGQGIDVVLLDHGSDDETAQVVEEFRDVVAEYAWHPFSGEFSLSEQLAWKRDIISRLSHDWVVHQDADESLRHADSVSSLRKAIEEASDADCTVIDFNEFVFLPAPGSRGKPGDFIDHLHGYYLFRPNHNRLNRAWKRRAKLDWIDSGGHRLTGSDCRYAATRHELRHYIGMSEEHLREKYCARKFSDEDLAKGWHRNRLGIDPERLKVPRQAKLLMPWGSGHAPLRSSHPAGKHYWQWQNEGPA